MTDVDDLNSDLSIFKAINPHGEAENNFISKQQLYDDVIDVTKLTNFALKIVIDEKLNAFKDALNEISGESENGDGESEDTNRHGFIRPSKSTLNIHVSVAYTFPFFDHFIIFDQIINTASKMHVL